MTGDERVESRVGDLFRDRDETLAVAESCTGGLVSSLITDVPGSSDYFDRAKVVYSYNSLRQELGVTRESLDEEGVVSRPVTKEMARRVRDMSGTDWGVANTGIAGPGGGKEDKPVGTAYIAVAYAAEWGTEESYAEVERYEFEGNRKDIKRMIAEKSLEKFIDEVRENS